MVNLFLSITHNNVLALTLFISISRTILVYLKVTSYTDIQLQGSMILNV